MTAFFRTVKFRLTLWYALILTVFLALFAFWMRSELSRALYRDADSSLFKQAVAIDDSLSVYWRDLAEKGQEKEDVLFPAAGSAGDTAKHGRVANLIKEWERSEQLLGRSDLIVRILCVNKSLVISNLKGWEREVIFPDFERDSSFMEQGRSYQTIHFRKKPVRLYYHRVDVRKHPLFVIEAGYPLQDVQATLARLDFIMIIWIPVAVAAAGVAGWFLARRTLRPIDLMIENARQITAAHLKGRLGRSHAGDELDRLAGTLNEMMDRIALSTKTVQEFSADVSHELKTPLAIIRGEIDLALRKSRTPEALVETLRVIEGEVNGLIRLVDDLLLLMRSDSNQLQFEKKRVSLREVLEYVARRFGERAHEKQVDMKVAPSPDLEIEGDEIYLKRLFSNLVDNAIKFTPQGGGVELKLEKHGALARVEVLDNGMGIDPSMREKVFSRFYRTDQARTHEGAGLGLAIAKVICDAHRGNLHIDSRAPHGTVVLVDLPLPA
ncbi:MAG TPA: HAMP domain-containing sensor histidine kinase [Verrucomicrobiae bacterium]|jgi:heavy metal sensor kinase|nr:HAMP domain-containing sensor histidine kinase [Verrucomicrobiae bacterium]